MDDCLFCKIIAGNIPSTKLYEDDDVYAFLDIAPNNPGHTLVIPKAHHENIYEMPESVLQKMSLAVKKMAVAVKEGVGAEGINIVMNNEAVAGQVIFHAHMHIIPRYKDDGFKPWPGGKYRNGEIEKTANKIKSALD